MTSHRLSWPAAVGLAVHADRVMALVVIVAFVFASCAQPPTATTTPTVPSAPAMEQPPSRSAAPDRSEPLSTGDIAEDDAMAIALSELARHMQRELGSDWIALTQGAMDGHLVAAGLPPDAVNALHDLMQSTIDAMPAAETLKEPQLHSDLRRQMRDALQKPGGGEIALDLRPETSADDSNDDGAGGASDDTCDLYNQCRGDNYTNCYDYANLEVQVHQAWLMAGCAFVAALGYVATLNPLAAAAVGAVCITAPSAWSAAVHSHAMDECFTLHCGSYPSCI